MPSYLTAKYAPDGFRVALIFDLTRPFVYLFEFASKALSAGFHLWDNVSLTGPPPEECKTKKIKSALLGSLAGFLLREGYHFGFLFVQP